MKEKDKQKLKRARRNRSKSDIRRNAILFTSKMQHRFKEMQKAEAWEEIENLGRYIKDVASKIRKFSKPGADRARSIHEAINQGISEKFKERPDLKEMVTCQKGCAHCCYIHVTTTKDEAGLLAEAAVEKEIPLDMEKLARQAEIPDAEWIKNPMDLIRCPFLGDDNLCMVYEERPSSCRTYFVASDPKNCDVSNGAKDVSTVFLEYPEVLASAALSVDIKEMSHTSLPHRLYHELQKEKYRGRIVQAGDKDAVVGHKVGQVQESGQQTDEDRRL